MHIRSSQGRDKNKTTATDKGVERLGSTWERDPSTSTLYLRAHVHSNSRQAFAEQSNRRRLPLTQIAPPMKQ